MRRRAYLASLAGVSTATLAGCASIDGTGGADASVPPPSVPERRLDRGGWVLAANPAPEQVYRQSMGSVGVVTATENTVAYEDEALRERLRADTLGEFPADGDALRVFFASRVEIEAPGNTDAWPVVGEAVFDGVRSVAAEQFVSELRANGVEDVTATGADRLAIDSGEQAEVTRFAGEYRYQELSIPVTRERSLTFPDGTVAVEGVLAAWRRQGRILLAGGAFPAESFDRQLSGDLTDAIAVTVDVDLGLEPDRYRSELYDLLRGVG